MFFSSGAKERGTFTNLIIVHARKTEYALTRPDYRLLSTLSQWNKIPYNHADQHYWQVVIYLKVKQVRQYMDECV